MEEFSDDMSLQRFLKVERDVPALIASGGWFHDGGEQSGLRLPCL